MMFWTLIVIVWEKQRPILMVTVFLILETIVQPLRMLTKQISMVMVWEMYVIVTMTMMVLQMMLIVMLLMRLLISAQELRVTMAMPTL